MSSPNVRERGHARSTAVVLIAAVALIVAPAWAAFAARGAFVVTCEFSHSLHDDPIVFSGQPGASHLHDFFGNESTDAFSTVRSLRRSPSNCFLESDTAAYWMPTLYVDGTRVRPDRVRAYYFGVSSARGSVETIPPRLQMIAGNATATTSDENPRVRWFCGAAQKLAIATPTSGHPYDCTAYAEGNDFVDGIVAKIVFPNCWNGVGTAPSDMTYDDGGSCPQEFPHVIPRLILRVHYGVMDPCAGAIPCTAEDAPDENIAVTLSSGSYVTYHADFWNAWHQRPLDRLVRDCLNKHIDCGGQRS